MTTKDFGKAPFVTNIEDATLENTNYRTALWTGELLQATLMSIPVGGDIGAEVHAENDQFLRVEQGKGRVIMGTDADNITLDTEVVPEFAIFIPKDTYHNVINIGDEDLKLYSIYGPAHHAHGTIHETQAIAMAAEEAEEADR
ncbi:cupin domain-containing protein [Streptococcus suis]|uniref:cupin domain-containing protein n=1 Tax=Streptococcus suis TaxID=1307 RepID=UPI001557964B|nr:cupin domain-containing protein [Streptococcus suis]NQL61147.1 cupin domain-containing protein [Streptococcus suis]NQM39036.1 cupin domain-containing protein [Streptococcus suis]UUM58385.1 cupin domain-containing protein [Streptococcus suis]UUM61766.1 cupin domain-containing protein [Streptococcus suis]